MRLRPEAPVTPPDPDSGGRRHAGQPDAFGDWFATTSAPPSRGRARIRRPRQDQAGVRRPRQDQAGVRRPRQDQAGVKRPRQDQAGVKRPPRDRFWWLLSPWLLAPTAAVAVATTGAALWLWQTAPTGEVQARPAVTITAPAATGGLPAGRAGHCVSSHRCRPA